jgi:hypothetical protein
VCQICGTNGHEVPGCWHRYDPNPPQKQFKFPGFASSYNPNMRPPSYNPYMRPSASLAFNQYSAMSEYGAPSVYSEAPGYPDSGATHHLTFNQQNLAQISPYNGQEQVLMGNGQGVCINSLGQSKIQPQFKPNIQLSLNNLLHVPNTSKNLISISMFAQDNKVIFEFHPYKCFVKCQASKQVLLEGFVGTDGLYQFQPLKFLVHKSASSHDFKSANVSNSNNSNTSSIACNSANSFVNSFQNWHLRLGHNHANAVKSVLNLCKIPFNNKMFWSFVMHVVLVNLINCMPRPLLPFIPPHLKSYTVIYGVLPHPHLILATIITSLCRCFHKIHLDLFSQI